MPVMTLSLATGSEGKMNKSSFSPFSRSYVFVGSLFLCLSVHSQKKCGGRVKGMERLHTRCSRTTDLLRCISKKGETADIC